MIVLTGESGVGKSTIEAELEKLGYRKAISHTTRKIREGEIDGVNYFYVTVEELLKLEEEGKLGEHIQYLGNHYALVKDQITDDSVVVVEPEGLRQLREKEDINIFAIYLYASEETRKQRMIGRGDKLENIHERLEGDKVVFKGVKDMVDGVVDTENKTIPEVLKEVVDLYEKALSRK